MSASFRNGSASRPNIQHDNGFLDLPGCTGSNPGITDYLVLGAWEAAYEAADTIKGHELADALAAYNHFLHGDGADRTFAHERFIANDPNGQTVIANAISSAQFGAENVVRQQFLNETEDFQFEMTSTAIKVGSTTGFPDPASQNWQKALGGHVIWMSGFVFVAIAHKLRNYDMDLTLHVEDRYNFNPGQADIASGAPDSWNGKLSCSGLAQQYMNYSTVNRRVAWIEGNAGKPSATTVLAPRSDSPRPRDRRTRERLRTN